MRRRQWATGLLGAVVVAGSTTLVPVSTTAAPPPSHDKRVDPTLGNGLGRLVSQSQQSSLRRAGGLRIDQESLAIRDDQGRVLVHLTPQSDADRTSFRKEAERAGLSVQAVDSEQGTLEGFAPLSAVRRLASLPETGTIAQALKPAANAGDAISQGVAMQRVDKVHRKGVDGRGITIGALSDSYDAATQTVTGEPLTVHAKQDVASGDLPGPANRRNRQPVAVIEDLETSADNTDEGRAMLQIAHDVAPASKLCFATAFTGLLGFADNVRRLADRKGSCGADVIVDDVIYFDEPMFSDNPLSDAIDDVADKGVHYFSSAGNQGLQQSWDSRVRLVSPQRGVRGTNIDLSDVDPELFDGGLQDMDPGSGTDVAQDLRLGEDGGLFDLQWDDPVDLDGPTVGDPVFDFEGELTEADPEVSFGYTPSRDLLGKEVQFRADAIPSGTTDLILSVDAPDGTNLGTIDTITSPETLAVKLNQPGQYTVTVSGFEGETGRFTADVSPVLAPSAVTTDFNALFFDADGNYVGAIADRNAATGRPSEIASIAGFDELQMVVARAGTGPVGATRLRNVLNGDMFFTEYSDPLSPAVWGHAAAKGATAVAAYDPFRPFLPEFFTSPGGDLPIYFDSEGNRLRRPEIRRVPQVAAADGGNTTFFTVDNPRDADAQPNFFGTSAAAPHAAAIAALALQKSGGPKRVSPAKLRTRLQKSAFKHDLDPNHSGGRAGGLSLSADGHQGYETRTVPGPMNDPRFFTLSYTGKVPLKSVTLYGETASPTALGRRNPPLSDGIVFDPRPFDGEAPFRNDGFPFTVGSTSGGLKAGNVAASFSVPAGGEATAGQFRRMTLKFRSDLERGQALQFGVDRDLAISGFGGANEGNGADELGGATFLPQGVAVPRGLAFVAERKDGKLIRGVMSNRLGKGWTPLDGYGVINAEKAVLGR